MTNIKTLNKNVSYVNERTLREFSYLKNNKTSGGTGFFISENGLLLTCWHVLAGNLLREVREMDEFKKIEATTESERIRKYLDANVQKIEIVLTDGSREKVILEDYDYQYDFAILKTLKSSGKKNFLELEIEVSLDYLDEALFCGFPESPYYSMETAPFAVNTGIVAAFPDLIIGGEKHVHTQLNGINLGGNSGAAVIRLGSNKVFCIINGNFIKSRDDFAIFKDKNNVEAGIMKAGFVVPLGITYATSLKTLSEKSLVFQKLLRRLSLRKRAKIAS